MSTLFRAEVARLEAELAAAQRLEATEKATSAAEEAEKIQAAGVALADAQHAAWPAAGCRRVELQVMVRRFWCDAAACARKIFAERFPNDVLPTFARRISRLGQIVHHLALALGGRPGAGPAQRLMLPVSLDTLLRVIRRRATTRR